MSGILLPACSIFFSLLLCFAFFFKKRINLVENNVYAIMLISSVIDSVLVTILQGLTFDGVTKGELLLIEILNGVDFIQNII